MSQELINVEAEMGKGYAVGMSLGLVIGFLLSNIGFGLVLGISLGAGVGNWLRQRKEDALLG